MDKLAVIWDIVKFLIIPFCLYLFQREIKSHDDKIAKREEERERDYAERKRVQDEKDKMVMRGLRTISDSMYEVIYQMQTGHHNGGLEANLEDITKYKADVNEWIIDRASKNH